MGAPEAVVENHLKRRVKETGGRIRKLVWQGRRGAPDRMCWWGPPLRAALVEVKRPGGEPEVHQQREIDKLRADGWDVRVIDTREGVDDFIGEMTK